MEVFLNHNHDVRRPPEGARVSMREKPRRNITELQTEHIGQICTGPARRTTVARPRSVGAGGARRSGALNGVVSGVLCVGPKSRAQAKSGTWPERASFAAPPLHPPSPLATELAAPVFVSSRSARAAPLRLPPFESPLLEPCAALATAESHWLCEAYARASSAQHDENAPCPCPVHAEAVAKSGIVVFKGASRAAGPAPPPSLIRFSPVQRTGASSRR